MQADGPCDDRGVHVKGVPDFVFIPVNKQNFISITITRAKQPVDYTACIENKGK